MTVYLVVSRDIDKNTHELYSEGISIFYSERDAKQEANELRKSGIFNQIDVYQSEVR